MTKAELKRNDIKARARETGGSIKPGAQAPGSRIPKIFWAHENGRQRCRPFPWARAL